MKLSKRGRRITAYLPGTRPRRRTALPSWRVLAEATGIPHSTLHRVFTTDRPVSLATARRLAAAFKIPLEEL